jgi:hypothetical protein
LNSQDNTDLILEEDLQEAMKLLEQLQTKEEFLPEQSPTLSALDLARRPKVKTACETCPNSMWFSSPEEVKCYCRIMHLISWSAKEANLITMCDGQFLN